MSTTLLALLGFICWSLFLLVLMEAIRSKLVLTGAVVANGFNPQNATLSPFMQLHGRANLTPWTVEQTNDEIVNLYRYWSVLHHELVPFFYSLTKEAHAGGPMPLRPIGEEASWPGDYRYTLGDAFLVAPLLDGTGKRDVIDGGHTVVGQPRGQACQGCVVDPLIAKRCEQGNPQAPWTKRGVGAGG